MGLSFEQHRRFEMNDKTTKITLTLDNDFWAKVEADYNAQLDEYYKALDEYYKAMEGSTLRRLINRVKALARRTK
jgi:hypothetical protein